MNSTNTVSENKFNGTKFTYANIRTVVPSSDKYPIYKKIDADKYDLVYAPTDWQKRGLQETASGYGNRLNSGYKINFNGKLRRLYTKCFSNSGMNYFMLKGEMIVVS
jgi:hypothetical protein